MPVEDHPVHPKTKIDNSFRYGCNNLKRERGTYLFREFVGGSIAVKFIQNRMSLDCQYDSSETDPACEDCKHSKRKDEGN